MTEYTGDRKLNIGWCESLQHIKKLTEELSSLNQLKQDFPKCAR